MSKVLRYIVLACYICINTLAYSQTKWVSLENNPKATAPTMTILTSDRTMYQVKVNIHGYYDEIVNEESTNYHKISLGTGFTTTEIGQPAMPTIPQLIALPTNRLCTSSISEDKWVDVTIGRIHPYQKPLLETEQSAKFVVNESVYNQDLYKTFLINRSDTSIWRDIRNIAFSICPFKYFPQTNKLSVLTEFVFTVRFSPQSDMPNSRIKQKNLSIFDNNFLVSNDVLSTDNTSYDYLIIVGDNSDLLGSQALKNFCKWKAIKGYKTKIVSIATTGASCSSIKKFIESEYNVNKSLSYVLFIGDDDRIPMYNKRSFQTSDILKSDYWYGCMDGDSDFQADIVVGRFSTNVVDELENMVNKTIVYESTDNQYAQYAQLIANKEYAPGKYQRCCEDIRTANYNTPITFIKTYGASTSNGGTNATNADIISRINEGVNIVNYRGHGDWDQWWNWNSQNQSFYNNDADLLRNTTYPVIFGIACTTADIRNHTCLLETFMKSKYGSAAYLGATVPSYTEANHTFDKILFKELLNNNIVNVGNLNLNAHIKNISERGDFTSKDNAFCYICGNDPALEIWTQRPQTFKNVTVSNQNDGIYINVDGVSDYMVSVVSKEGELRYKKTSMSNTITLSDYNTEDLIYLSKHNYIPFKIEIQNSNPNTIYIQNRVFNGSEIINGDKIEVGYDVTSSIPYGNVIINNGANLRLNSTSETIIKNGFECQKGATFIVE